MKVTIFSDLHGSIQALEKLLKLEKKTDVFFFLGDAVNYGPWSNECVQLLDTIDNCVCIKGNHEDYFLNGCYRGTNEIALSFFNHCYPFFKEQKLIFKYLEECKFLDFTFKHTINKQNIYSDSEIELSENLFIGHTHHQFTIENNSFVLCNPGSLGQNRNNIEKSNYINWFPKDNIIKYHYFDTPVLPIISEMKLRKYPDICINYYKSKIR